MGVEITPAAIIRLIFPEKTRLVLPEDKADPHAYVPDWPPDMFAAAGYLLHHSGAYHNLTPGGAFVTSGTAEMTITRDERAAIVAAAKEWIDGDPLPPAFAQECWGRIMSSTLHVCARRGSSGGGPPEWWKDALTLSILADEASLNVGHMGVQADPLAKMVNDALSAATEEKMGEVDGLTTISESPHTICACASPDIVTVLPKARTPDTGVTLRSMSHNLSLLPATGVLQAGWQNIANAQLHPANGSPFNCLLIPFPYVVDSNWFSIEDGNDRWKWFHLKQGWLPPKDKWPQFIKFIDAMISEARRKRTGPIHAIVFPEYALTWELHSELSKHIEKQHEWVQFLISGSSSNCEGANGNFVLTTQFLDVFVGGKRKHTSFTTSREKHHRWKLTPPQIRSYQLTSSFGGDYEKQVFWERLHVPRRKVLANPFRQHSILSVLICEDLARIEPCHQYLRALGPNIVLCLLMDGPQLESRWSAKYALPLAEDPGSAVVTVTSRALVKRAATYRRDEQGEQDASWSVALVRTPDLTTTSISCERTSEAVLISLVGSQSDEITIEGRYQSKGSTWKLEDSVTVELNRSDTLQKALLDQFVPDHL